jgi:hypothetical protein
MVCDQRVKQWGEGSEGCIRSRRFSLLPTERMRCNQGLSLVVEDSHMASVDLDPTVDPLKIVVAKRGA